MIILLCYGKTSPVPRLTVFGNKKCLTADFFWIYANYLSVIQTCKSLAKRKGLALRNIEGGIGIGVAFSLGDIDPDSDPDSDPDVVWLRLCRAVQILENPRLSTL
jgi:hypothetical protein